MVIDKPFNRFGIWFPITGVIASALLLFGIFMAGYKFLNWNLTLETISVLTIIWYISWGLVGLLGWKISKTKVRDVFSLKNVKPKNILQVVGIAVIAQIAIIGLTYAVSKLLNHEIKGNASDLIPAGTTPIVLILTASVAIIFAPIFEEILFRGLIFDGFLNTTRKLKASNKVSTVLALTFTSLFFGLAHVSSLDLNGLVVFLATGLFGLYLAFLRVRTGSLTLGIIGHMSFNAVTIVLLLVAQ